MTSRCFALPVLVALIGACLAACGSDADDEVTEEPVPRTARKAKSPKSQTAGTPAAEGTTGTPATEGPTAPEPSGPPAPTQGCSAAAASATGLSHRTLNVNGQVRTYDLTVPASYAPAQAYPLVFVFHGGGGTAASARGTFSFENIAGDAAVFVYPDGQDNNWDLDAPTNQNRDVALFDQLLTTLEGELCLDSSRVFAAGYSNGAYFANQLGCRRGDKLRAVASHAGGGPYGNDDGYDDQGNLKCAGPPPAVMLVHGEADPVVPVSALESSLSHWKWANACDSAQTARVPTPCVGVNGCASPVVVCRVPAMGHAVWGPGAKATWDFFASF